MTKLQEKQSAFQTYLEQFGNQYNHNWSGYIEQGGKRYATIPFTSYGYYDNSCMVERANYAWFLKHYGKRSGVYHFSGMHGFHAMAVLFDELSSKTIDDIAGYLEQISDYPSIDDELLSKMEFQAIRQSFNEDWASELKRNQKSKAWNMVVADMGNLAYVEAGGNVYIDWDRLRIELAGLSNPDNSSQPSFDDLYPVY